VLGLFSACGGGGSSPVAPTLPTPQGFDVVAVVFYDENGNGSLDASETARIPEVTVEIAGRSARSERATGRATVTGVPEGTHNVTLRSLPPYYAPGRSPTAVSPQPAASDVMVPVTLALGANRATTYLVFGDSITDGDGSSDGDGYRGRLERLLVPHFNKAQVSKDGEPGTTSDRGAARITRSLQRFRPAFTLVLYGTNDWNTSACNSDIARCFTATSIQTMIRNIRAQDSHPIVSTIPPANTGYDTRAPEDRNLRVEQMNAQIKEVAAAERVAVADTYVAFARAAQGDYKRYFVDHVHPNDAGFELIAQSFFEALSAPFGTSASGVPLWLPELFATPQRPLARSRARPGPAVE
jgi:lysophospholipase L1-like esterase